MSKLLKERREELGKELRTIAEVTRIKGAYLRSIEEEEFDKLPVEVYTRGYIREYAEFLGIPVDIAIEPYEKYLRENKAGKEKETYNGKTVATFTREVAESLDAFKVQGDMEDVDMLLVPEGAFSRSRKTFPFKILWIVLAVAIAAGIYFFLPARKNTPPATHGNEQTVQVPWTSSPPSSWNPQPPIQSPEHATHVPEMNKSLEKPSVPKDAKDRLASKQEKPQLQGEKIATAKKKHMLNIYATDRVWIRVVIDGTENKQMLLYKGDKVSFGANESLVLTVGNAAGAKINFDGKSFEDLGAEGQVVRFNFPHSTLPQPEPPSEPVPSLEAPETSER
ncbi:MAG: helix-turn-helix domain-containing protein [Dissulfurispiraceae bacterium]